MATPPRANRPRTEDAAGTRSRFSAFQARISLGRLRKRESGAYLLLLGTTLFLVIIGLVMVLSSSSVTSFVGQNGFFGVFLRQGTFALIGVPLMLVMSRVPLSFWRKYAWHMLGAGMFLQLLVFVPGVGIDNFGNQNWIAIGPIRGQPSEFLKLGLIIWMGLILWRKQHLLDNWKHALIPIFPAAGLAIGLVLLGHDLGTGMIMFAILIGALFFANIRLRIIGIPLALGALAVGMLTITSPNRVARIAQFAGDTCTISDPLCWQPLHGLWAMANGGVFGVGLGNSKAKWSWLPAAENDYIFAIIGEELGMVGAIVVILLYVVLTIALIRVMRNARDLFGTVVTGAVLVWIIGQAFVNIGVVIGLLPVLGVPLPLLSAGGTALISCLMGIGVVLSIARDSDRPDEDAKRAHQFSNPATFTPSLRRTR